MTFRASDVTPTRRWTVSRPAHCGRLHSTGVGWQHTDGHRCRLCQDLVRFFHHRSVGSALEGAWQPAADAARQGTL